MNSETIDGGSVVASMSATEKHRQQRSHLSEHESSGASLSVNPSSLKLPIVEKHVSQLAGPTTDSVVDTVRTNSPSESNFSFAPSALLVLGAGGGLAAYFLGGGLLS